jgi:glycosyltransferase involved in cell wall biosynthesis
MKKVLQLITRLDKGGSAELVLQTCQKLVSQNFSVTLVTGKTDDPPVDIIQTAKSNNFKLIILDSLVRNIHPIKDLRAFFQIKKILKDEKPDSLHTNSSKAGFIGRLAGYSVGVEKIYHSPHGHIFYGYYSGFVTALFVFLEKIAARRTTKIFNLTKKGREDHINRKIAPSEKFIVSSCGIDLSKFQAEKPKDYPQNRIKILWAGRFAPIKNPQMVLRVAEILNNENMEFRMVGDGELQPKIQNEFRSRQLKNITLPGYNAELQREFFAADIFIITSKNEGFGRVIVEAMAAGLPIIATKVGGIPEIVTHGENGFLVNSEDAEAMAKNILSLLDNKVKYAQISKNNMEKSKDYSLDKYVANLTNYY